METNRSTVFCYLFCQIYDFLFCSFTCVRRRMEIYRINLNTTFCDHITSYRAVDTAREKKHSFSVCSDWHSACSLDCLGIYINLVTDFYRKSKLRIMYVYACIREFIQNTSAKFCTDFHRCDWIGLLCSSCIYFEASIVIWMAVLHVRNNILCHLLKSQLLIDHYRANSDNTKYML